MNQIEQTYTINAPISKVWQAFTNTSVAEQWGASPATVDAREGGEFSYWGGDIHGIFTKLVPEKSIEQDWYEHDHPERLHKVVFSLEVSGERATTVRLLQTGVGDDELTSMAAGWRDYYIDPIKRLLEK